MCHHSSPSRGKKIDEDSAAALRPMESTSRELSRALTMHAALVRLNLAKGEAEGTLHVHIVGADSREGSDPAATANVFAPLCSHLAGSHWREVSLLLCGPNCTGAEGELVSCGNVTTDPKAPVLSIRYSHQLYEDYRRMSLDAPPPHLAVAFNAGVWGYSTWSGCVEAICTGSSCPLVLTAYNEFEAEEDEDSLRSYGVSHFVWTAEPNPHRSLVREERRGTMPHAHFENASWMCMQGPLSPPTAGNAPHEVASDPQLMMDEEEHQMRGFSAEDEIVMPMPVFDDSSDDEKGDGDRGESQMAAAAKWPAVAPGPPVVSAPPAAQVERTLYGDPAHAHSERSMHATSSLDELRDEQSIPAARRLHRVAYAQLSHAGFEALQHQPMLVEGMPQHEGWPGLERWASEAKLLDSTLGQRLELPITELFPLHGLGKPQKLRLPLPTYREYAASNEVDFPYYPWERDFDQPASRDLLNYWWPPSVLSEDDDLFGHSDATRAAFPFSCHRFVIIGGARTGAVAHQDPKCSAAWNTCLVGSKRWIFLPPSVSAAEMHAATSTANGNENENYRRVPPAYWWTDAYPRLVASGLPMYECVQHASDTVYVPPGWWHAVLNLPHAPEEALTLCVTQNTLTPAMLPGLVTWAELRESLGPQLSLEFAFAMQETRPQLVARLLEASEPGSEAAEELRTVMKGRPSEDMAAQSSSGGDGGEPAACELEEDAGDDDDDDASVAALAEEVARYVEAASARRREVAASGAPSHEETPFGAVDRLESSQWSVARFRQTYIRKGEPAVLLGLASVVAQPFGEPDEDASRGDAAAGDGDTQSLCGGLDRWGWLDWLARACGSKHVEVLHAHPRSYSGSQPPSSSMMLLGEFISRLKEGRADGLYMYDISLSKRLPTVLDCVRLPRYFAHCYLLRTMRAHRFSHAWPTLFLGARGTRSTLHLDQWHGHFWMYCLFGCKRWTLFHPDDIPLLYPDWSHGGVHPRFPSLYELQARPDRYPLFRKARRREVIIHPGEVLFVPGGTPHAVENLTDCLAVAGNFVDESNLDAALADMRVLARRDKSVGDAAEALAEMELDPEHGMSAEVLPAEDLVVGFNPGRS